MHNNPVQVARLGSPSCMVQEVPANPKEQQIASGSPVDAAMAGFGSPVHTGSESAPITAGHAPAMYMPIGGSSFGGAAEAPGCYC